MDLDPTIAEKSDGMLSFVEGCAGRIGAQSVLGPGPDWDLYGPIYGPIWALMGPYMGPYGPIWALMGPPGQVLEDYVNFP